MERNSDLQRELLAREYKYWHAIQERDADAASRLSGETCLVVGAQGVSALDREALAGMLEHADYELEDFGLEDVHFRRVSDDVAVLAYKVSEDLRVKGERTLLEAYDASVWMRRGGDWVCVVHTETPAGDPFGRH